MKRQCKKCGKNICSQNKSGYCQTCLIEINRKKKIQSWLETGQTGYTVDTTIRGVIREYILKEQEQCCAICGIKNVWNGNELHFILDHIDGNASNSCRENLRLVCPNCDSQLDTYKSRNKNSARNARKQFLKDTAPRGKK